VKIYILYSSLVLFKRRLRKEMDRSAIRHPKIYSLNYVVTHESEDVQLEKFLGPYFEDFLKIYSDFYLHFK